MKRQYFFESFAQNRHPLNYRGSMKTLIAVTLSMVFCSFAAEPDMEKNIMPRKKGMKWFYQGKAYDQGKVVAQGIVTEEVEEVIQIDGVNCYKIRNTFDFRSVAERVAGVKLTPEDIDFFWEYSSDKGSYNFANYDDKDRPVAPKKLADFSLTLPYPVKKGHSYKAEGSDWVVLAVDQKVEVPAGIHTCVVYQSTNSQGEESEWDRATLYMAPGIGLIRFDIEIRKGGKWVLSSRDDLVRIEK